MKNLTFTLNAFLVGVLIALMTGVFNPIEAIHGVVAQATPDRPKTLGPAESPFSKDNFRYPYNSGNNRKASADYALPYVELRTGDDKPLLIDFNADGLPDLLYSQVSNPSNQPNSDAAEEPNVIQYVLLNNGKGFDLVYNCYYDNSRNHWGDCAD